jgi:hypothetical protein
VFLQLESESDNGNEERTVEGWSHGAVGDSDEYEEVKAVIECIKDPPKGRYGGLELERKHKTETPDK